MNTKFLVGALAAGAFAPIALVAVAEPAQAFSWDVENREWVIIHDGDENISFDVFFYNATIEGENVEGLNAKATFSLLGAFDATTKQADFKVDLENFSDGSLWYSARLSGLAFDVDPNLADSRDAVTASGIFNNAFVDSNYPEGVKTVEVCYSDGGSCSGGGGGGVTLGDTGSFYTTLKFDSVADNFNIRMDSFVSRWQSLTSQKDNRLDYEYSGDSGVGYGQVPTPALIPALIGSGIAALRKRKKENAEQVEESIQV